MTNEEAITRIEDHMTMHRLHEPRAILITEALNMAIKAIEKQNPKKPIFEDLGYDLHHNFNVYGILCPECGGLIIQCDDDDFGGEFPNAIWEEWDMEAVENDNGYCGHCGQRLDWSKGETE